MILDSGSFYVTDLQAETHTNPRMALYYVDKTSIKQINFFLPSLVHKGCCRRAEHIKELPQAVTEADSSSGENNRIEIRLRTPKWRFPEDLNTFL
jgi:hypothetical protein